jgi:ribosomal protein S12 methylthiotransferase accessory factor
MIELHTSLRSAPPEDTLLRARAFGARLGISRVTDITRLDRVGIPVFASIRPAAVEGSLCVNAGKGVRPIEAEVGAWMEAIEFACAEPDAAGLEVRLATARKVLDGDIRPEAILDFCPIMRRYIDLDAPLACVEAEELAGGGTTLVPAELVLLPYVKRPGTGNFGSHSNGLASGNTVAEATVHALFELIERDVRSFEAIRDDARAVSLSRVPPAIQAMVSRMEAAGLAVGVRTQGNPFHIPYFEAALWEPHSRTTLFLNGGYGCHLVPEIALLRALTEAAQSRLSYIHAGRDDLVDRYAALAAVPEEELAADAEAQFALHVAGDGSPEFTGGWDGAVPGSIDEALSTIMERLLQAELRHVCRVVYTRPSDPVQVVRVIVPGLEYFTESSRRVGPRLARFSKAQRE